MEESIAQNIRKGIQFRARFNTWVNLGRKIVLIKFALSYQRKGRSKQIPTIRLKLKKKRNDIKI